MNNRIRIAGAVCVGVLSVTACGSSSSPKAATVTTKPAVTATTKPAATPTTKPATATTKPATATTKPATATTKPATPTTKPATKPAAPAATASAAVDLGTTTIGKVLTDSKGMTLYAFEKDTKGKSSACDATCAKTWMPDEVTGKATAGTGVDAAKLGTITRSDGTTQVTYNGWPLYRYSGDAKSGDVKGDKLQSEWFAVNAKGATV